MAEALGKAAYAQKGTTLRVMAATKTTVVFDQMAASVPKIMDTTS
jgi:hypothetical protein